MNDLLICAPLTIAAVIVSVVLVLTVTRPREAATVDSARPVNKWGVAYFVVAALTGILFAVTMAATGRMNQLGALGCIYALVVLFAPFALMAFYRALRWARIL